MADQTELLFQMASLALKGKTVLVTGGTGGIGAAIVKAFLRSSANVIITGTSQAKLDKLIQLLPKDGGRIWGFVCDLRDASQVERVVKVTMKEQCPPIDVLINNAGYALNATVPFWEQDLADVDAVLGVDVNGLMYITHAVMKHHMMTRSPHPTGTIVNISSITGHQAPLKEGYEASYHTSKAAVEGFTNVLRHETVGTNIRVLLHRPGTTLTEFHTRRHNYDREKTDATFAGLMALEAEDLAYGILWQCLQPERVSVVLMETLPTSQRSLYVYDREYEKRNA